MTHVKAMIAGVCLAIALPALAQPLVNDVSYIAAARCQGLINSADLGPQDVTAINRFMDYQAAGRTQLALDHAADAKARAHRESATADGAMRAQLIAERDGPCQQWVQMAGG